MTWPKVESTAERFGIRPIITGPTACHERLKRRRWGISSRPRLAVASGCGSWAPPGAVPRRHRAAAARSQVLPEGGVSTGPIRSSSAAVTNAYEHTLPHTGTDSGCMLLRGAGPRRPVLADVHRSVVPYLDTLDLEVLRLDDWKDAMPRFHGSVLAEPSCSDDTQARDCRWCLVAAAVGDRRPRPPPATGVRSVAQRALRCTSSSSTDRSASPSVLLTTSAMPISRASATTRWSIAALKSTICTSGSR